MQEANPIQAVPTTPQTIVQPSKSNFLTILLSVLLVISVSISGFFAYQTQKLVKELQEIRNVEELVETTEPTIEPVATKNSEVDPTENWKTYTNTEFGFMFKYPQDMFFKIETGSGGDIKMVPWKSSIVGTSSTILVAVELRSCNNWNGINKSIINGKESVRFYPETPTGLKITSADMVEIQVKNNVCLVIGKYVEEIDKKGLTNQDEIKKVMERLSLIDKGMFDILLSTFKFIN